MPSTPFGDHLKRERELRGVTLEEVAAATRISPRFLEALENEQWDRLPGGAFNRGFIRSVARYLGLDEENMVAEYALETRGSNEGATSAGDQGMPRDFRPVIIGALVLVVIIIVLAIGVHYYRRRAHGHLAAPSQDIPVAPSTPVTPPTGQPTTPAQPSSPGGSH